MKNLKFIYIIIFLFPLKLSAQFSVEKFLNEPLDQTMSSIKEKLTDKNIEEILDGTFNIVRFYDWLEPVSIKVTFMFKKDGKQISKAISNAKESEEDARKLFEILNDELVKKFGQSLSKKSLLGATAYSWAGIGGSVITLGQESKKTRLMIMTFK